MWKKGNIFDAFLIKFLFIEAGLMAGYVIFYKILILSMLQKKRLDNHYNEFIYLKLKIIIF